MLLGEGIYLVLVIYAVLAWAVVVARLEKTGG